MSGMPLPPEFIITEAELNSKPANRIAALYRDKLRKQIAKGFKYSPKEISEHLKQLSKK